MRRRAIGPVFPCGISVAPIPDRLPRLLLGLTLALVACGSAAETATNEPTTEKVAASAEMECTHAVALSEETVATPLPAVHCPSGWTARARSSSLPVTGRFTTADDLIAAFCTQSDASAEAPTVAGVDFAHEDVLAAVYAGEIGMYRHGADLWIKHTIRSCDTRSYKSALYVVPKNVEPSEQSCVLSCR